MIVKAYIPVSKIAQAVNFLDNLPSELRPSSYSANESPLKPKGKISDIEKFEAFIAKNQYGFFLFGENARYNVFFRPKNGFCNIVVDCLGDVLCEDNVLPLLKILASAGSEFSFAASAEEYEHRNRYVRTLGDSGFEAWLGRDLRKYIPGVYWITAFSKKYLECLSLVSADLRAEIIPIGNGAALVKIFTLPSDWKMHAEEIDQWLVSHGEFFSKCRIISLLDQAPDLGVLSLIAAEYP